MLRSKATQVTNALAQRQFERGFPLYMTWENSISFANLSLQLHSREVLTQVSLNMVLTQESVNNSVSLISTGLYMNARAIYVYMALRAIYMYIALTWGQSTTIWRQLAEIYEYWWWITRCNLVHIYCFLFCLRKRIYLYIIYSYITSNFGLKNILMTC